jgi:hypothetical protein
MDDRKSVLCVALLCLSIPFAPASLLAHDPEQPVERSTETEARRRQREETLKAMEQRAREMKVRRAGARPDAQAEAGAELIPQPLFHYTDEPRRILDATLWGWTSQGRLLAICKIENYEGQSHPEGQWLYCFGSLSRGLVEAEWSDGHRWTAQKPGLELALLPKAPAPAEGKAARLRQMKEIAKRFDATIIDTPVNRRQQMRLLPRPLHRYETPAGELLDGAIFGLTTNGTNPDAILAVELHKTEAPEPEWKFAVAGMTQGALSVRFDEKEVWTKPYATAIGSYETWNWFWENAK